MSREPDPTIASPHYDADEPLPTAVPAPPVTQGADEAANRGKRAPREGSGVVTGSGAGAGGGGTAEDYDSDAAGGSQAL